MATELAEAMIRPARFVLKDAGVEGELVVTQKSGCWVKIWPDGIDGPVITSEESLCDLLQEARELLYEALQDCNPNYMIVQKGNAFLARTSWPSLAYDTGKIYGSEVTTILGDETKKNRTKDLPEVPPVMEKLVNAMLNLYDASTHFEKGSESQETLKNWAFQIHAFLTGKSK